MTGMNEDERPSTAPRRDTHRVPRKRIWSARALPRRPHRGGHSAPRNGVPPTLTSYVLHEGEDTVLVDPLVAGESEALLTALDEVVRGRVRILVTTPFHVRGSELLWRRWREHHEVTIFGHEHCATRLDDRAAFRPLRRRRDARGRRARALDRTAAARRDSLQFPVASRPGLRRHRARDRRRASRLAEAPRASPYLVRGAFPRRSSR